MADDINKNNKDNIAENNPVSDADKNSDKKASSDYTQQQEEKMQEEKQPSQPETNANYEKKKALVLDYCKSVKISFVAMLIFCGISFFLIFITLFEAYDRRSYDHAEPIIYGVILLVVALIIFIHEARKYSKANRELIGY